MLIIFDCDGVLVDSETLAARELGRYLKDIEFPIIVTETMHSQFLGLTLKNIRMVLEADAGRSLPDNFEEEIRERDKVAFHRYLRAIPGVHEVASGLNFSKCVASSGSYDKIHNSLNITGLLNYFKPHIFSAGDPAVRQGKPAPDLFQHAAKVMGFSNQECIVIEDSVAGVTAGLAARMFTVGFTGGAHCQINHKERLERAGANVIMSHMVSLPSIINQVLTKQSS